MKTIILNASPRRSGNISKMLKASINGLHPSDEFEMIHVNELYIKPCISCMKCRTENQCVLPDDDAHIVGKKIEMADQLIIGTPVFWGNMPGTLKVLFDRNVFRFMDTSKPGIPKKKMKGKKAVLMIACSVPKLTDVLTGQSFSCKKSVNTILKSGGIQISRTFVLSNSRKNQDVTHEMTEKITNFMKRNSLSIRSESKS